MKLGDIDIPTEQIGDLYQLAGIILGGPGDEWVSMLLPFFPDAPGGEWQFTTPSDEEWQAWLKQSDDPVTPIGKALVRKSSRQIDESIKWRVYKRDNFSCVYCGKDGVPMTVDHYDAQKFGGLTTYDNLLSSCRPCNKKKGHMTVAEWQGYCAAKGLNDGTEYIAEIRSSNGVYRP